MPEMMNFKVTQTREVEVVANSTVDAIRLAEAAFEHGHLGQSASIAKDKSPEGVWGNTRSRINELSLHAERK